MLAHGLLVKLVNVFQSFLKVSGIELREGLLISMNKLFSHLLKKLVASILRILLHLEILSFFVFSGAILQVFKLFNSFL